MSSRSGRIRGSGRYPGPLGTATKEDSGEHDVWERIEQARERWNVLEHPFYERWSAGELTREELAEYSGQYRHATAAIAELSASIAESAPEDERVELRRHAAEEEAHVALWDGFLDAVGGDAGAAPTTETAECVEAWTADGDRLAQLVRLYAIESGQPQISRTKREGLPPTTGSATGPATSTSGSTRRPTCTTPPRVAR